MLFGSLVSPTVIKPARSGSTQLPGGHGETVMKRRGKSQDNLKTSEVYVYRKVTRSTCRLVGSPLDETRSMHVQKKCTTASGNDPCVPRTPNSMQGARNSAGGGMSFWVAVIAIGINRPQPYRCVFLTEFGPVWPCSLRPTPWLPDAASLPLTPLNSPDRSVRSVPSRF